MKQKDPHLPYILGGRGSKDGACQTSTSDTKAERREGGGPGSGAHSMAMPSPSHSTSPAALNVLARCHLRLRGPIPSGGHAASAVTADSVTLLSTAVVAFPHTLASM